MVTGIFTGESVAGLGNTIKAYLIIYVTDKRVINYLNRADSLIFWLPALFLRGVLLVPQHTFPHFASRLWVNFSNTRLYLDLELTYPIEYSRAWLYIVMIFSIGVKAWQLWHGAKI